MNIRVSRHAYERAKERLGLNKKAFRRIAKRSFDEGISRQDLTGSLRRYLDKLFLSHGAADNSKIYGMHIYLFAGNTLVTILEVPSRYKRYVKNLK